MSNIKQSLIGLAWVWLASIAHATVTEVGAERCGRRLQRGHQG